MQQLLQVRVNNVCGVFCVFSVRFILMEATAQASIRLLDKQCFELQGRLDFSSVPALLTAAVNDLPLTNENTGFEVDLLKVEHSNSAGIAMLLELNRIGLGLNKSMRIKNMPEQMEVIARVHGVDELLNALFEG